tara:strand:- start:1011 stop:1262 length:252 start_codon:yes stop_codon:yes gene_type:complete
MRVISPEQQKQINLKQREYYHRQKFRKENPDAIEGRYVAYRTIKEHTDTTCEVCNVIIRKNSVSSHVKSNYHIQKLNKLNKDN